MTAILIKRGRDTGAQRDNRVRTKQWECDYLQAKEKGLEQILPLWSSGEINLHLGLLASRAMGK